MFNTDKALGKLFNDTLGNEVQFREAQTIKSNSDERIYVWLHQLAGLNVDQKSLGPLSEIPKYLISE